MQPTAHPVDRYESTRTAWETIWQQADVPAELQAVQSARSQAIIAAYQPYLPTDAPILEAGSGLGAVLHTLQARGYPVFGLDYAHNALQAAKHHDPGQLLMTGDVHDLPVADGTLGAYLSFGVLEHFEHGMGLALQEAHRALKQHGVLVLTIPYPNVIYRLVQLKRRVRGQSTLTDDNFYESAYSKAALVDEVQRAGFRVLLARPTSHSFTLWGLGGAFRGAGYYETSPLAEALGAVADKYAPWWFNFMTLVVARKR